MAETHPERERAPEQVGSPSGRGTEAEPAALGLTIRAPSASCAWHARPGTPPSSRRSAPPRPQQTDREPLAQAPVADAVLGSGLRRAVLLRADVARQPTPPPTTPPANDAEAAARELWEGLTHREALKDGEREGMLRLALKLGQRYDEIRGAWSKVSGRTLDEDVRSHAGSSMDAARVLAYLKHGRLRLADKIYMAVAMPGTDEGTLFRLLPEAYADRGASKDFAADYGTGSPRTGSCWTALPTASRASSAAAPPTPSRASSPGWVGSGELSGPEYVHGMALLTYGKLRAIDKLRMAIVEISASDGAINAALSELAHTSPAGIAGGNAIEKDYTKSYGTFLGTDLEEKLGRYSDALKRAKLLLGGKFTARERIRIATDGLANDWGEIWAALQDATPEELVTLRAEWESKGEIHTLINGTTGELSRPRTPTCAASRRSSRPAPSARARASSSKDLMTARGLPYEPGAIVKAALEDAAVEQAFIAAAGRPSSSRAPRPAGGRRWPGSRAGLGHVAEVGRPRCGRSSASSACSCAPRRRRIARRCATTTP